LIGKIWSRKRERRKLRFRLTGLRYCWKKRRNKRRKRTLGGGVYNYDYMLVRKERAVLEKLI